jgi:enterochelin esterase family protein
MKKPIRSHAVATVLLLFACPLLLPAQDMPLSQVLIDGADWEVAVEGFEFTDGLSTDSEGNLYFSDVKGGDSVYRADLEGKVEKFYPDSPGISGLQWSADGLLYACVAREKRVVRFDKGGAKTDLATDVRPNDLVVTHDGNLYFTMTPTKEIRRIAPDGAMTVVSEGVVTKPNGITLSRDQGTLAVSDHGGKHVWTFRIEKDGTLSHATPYMTMRTPTADPEIAKGDGMATDKHGRYYVTSAEGLQMFDPTGRMGGVIATPDPEKPLVSVCFAGPGHEWLYVANGGTIYRRKTKTAGALFFEEPKPAEAPPK